MDLVLLGMAEVAADVAVAAKAMGAPAEVTAVVAVALVWAAARAVVMAAEAALAVGVETERV